MLSAKLSQRRQSPRDQLDPPSDGNGEAYPRTRVCVCRLTPQEPTRRKDTPKKKAPRIIYQKREKKAPRIIYQRGKTKN